MRQPRASVAADPRVANGGITSDIKLPDFANLSFFHTMLNDKWDFMARRPVDALEHASRT